VLLVDDDDAPNNLFAYSGAMDALGLPYDVWDTRRSGAVPLPDALATRTRVFWSGSAHNEEGVPDAAEGRLANWLATGQCLLVSSRESLLDGSGTGTHYWFATEYLGLSNWEQGDPFSSVAGEGPDFSGLGPYALTMSPSIWNFRLTPSDTGKSAFSDSQGTIGVQNDNGAFRTLFLSFPLEDISPDAAQSVISRFMDYCAKPPELPPDPIFGSSFETGA
jgi:hypothetical protein